MIEGWEQWRRKLPGYRGRRIVALPLLAVGSAFVGATYLLALESLPLVYRRSGLVEALEPALPVVGTVTVLLAGFVSVSRVWTRRDRYLAESPTTAYQRALPFGLVGIGLIFASVVNGFTPAYQLSQGALQHSLSTALSLPLTELLAVTDRVGWLVRGALGLGAFGLGTLVAVRSVRTFGMDDAALVSLYYPEESEMEDHAIYSVVRHPIYAGWLLWMAGGSLYRLSLYGVVDFALFYLALVLWLRRYEEPELIERFGDGYREYRRAVPAFVPRPGGIRTYVAFLFGRDGA